MTHWRRIALAALLFASPACSPKHAPNETVATVGGVPIARRLVDTRSRLYEGNASVSDPHVLAMAQLILGQLSSQVLSRYGRAVTDGTALECWNHEAEILPEPYKTVTTAMTDTRLWVDAIVFPVCSAVLLEDFYKNNPAASRELKEKAIRLHRTLLADPARFDEIAEQERLRVDQLWIGKETLRVAGETPKGATPPPYSDEEKRQAAELFRALQATQPGSVYGRLINTPDAMQIIKVEERGIDMARTSVLMFPKNSMDAWFWGDAGKIPVTVTDGSLKKKFLQTVAWSKKVQLEE